MLLTCSPLLLQVSPSSRPSWSRLWPTTGRWLLALLGTLWTPLSTDASLKRWTAGRRNAFWWTVRWTGSTLSWSRYRDRTFSDPSSIRLLLSCLFYTHLFQASGFRLQARGGFQMSPHSCFLGELQRSYMSHSQQTQTAQWDGSAENSCFPKSGNDALIYLRDH